MNKQSNDIQTSSKKKTSTSNTNSDSNPEPQTLFCSSWTPRATRATPWTMQQWSRGLRRCSPLTKTGRT